jgi:uncharacterized protein (UPF0335 family)
MTDLYDRAVALVTEHQKASTSWLQRQLRIGYNEAARYIERMERDGFVGSPDHVGRREVLRPPSAALPESSAVITPSVPAWERNAGKFDAPATGTPTVHRERLTIGHQPTYETFAPLKSPDAAAVADRPVEDLAADLVRILGLDGARQLVRSAAQGEGMALAPAVSTPSADWLKKIIERLLGLYGERRDLAQEIRDVFSFAKDIGLNVKALRRTIADIEADKEGRFELEANTAIYRAIMGVEEPDFVIELPSGPPPAPANAKKITAKEKQYRQALALTSAAHAIIDI